MHCWLHGCKLVDANAYANNTRMRLAGNEIGTFHAAPAETEWDADDVRVYTDTQILYSRGKECFSVVVKSHVETKPRRQVGSYSRKPVPFPDLIESSIYGPRWMECLAQPQGKVFVVSLGGPLRTGPALLVGAPPVAGL
ncbi:hypothetical protein ALC60_12429 [Trachymyrmex zeteki]|uniref:Uncharacterized protein n=1 Tax=Mycetomoellerius zeteki TaxID=64791 RepID=A0A151WKW1_9HYME|nr:hypothetical protein ALC60_12429 [Trachymyrmex zeteki]